MLIAPDSPTSSPRSRAGETSLNYTLISVCFGLLAFSLLVGWSLASGRVPLERAFLLMSLAPLCLGVFQIYGFATMRGRRDGGLLLGGLGWLLLAFGLWTQQNFYNASVLAGQAPGQIGTAPFTRLLAILAAFCIAAGAVLSVFHWQNLNKNA